MPVPTGNLATLGADPPERDLAWETNGNKIRHAPGDLARAILELALKGREK